MFFQFRCALLDMPDDLLDVLPTILASLEQDPESRRAALLQLAQLVDASLSVPSLVRSEAAAMAAAKRAGLGMAERQLLREALRRHKADVLSAAEPAIVEITDDAEAHHVVAAQAELLEARRRAAAKAAEADLGEEAVANGAVRPLYRWTQEPDDLTAVVLLPPGTEKRRVVCVFRPQSLVVGLRGEPPIIDAPLRGRVKVEECVWQLQDSHRLVLQMHKVAPPTPRGACYVGAASTTAPTSDPRSSPSAGLTSWSCYCRRANFSRR